LAAEEPSRQLSRPGFFFDERSKQQLNSPSYPVHLNEAFSNVAPKPTCIVLARPIAKGFSSSFKPAKSGEEGSRREEAREASVEEVVALDKAETRAALTAAAKLALSF